jgi:hypothetical protein
MIFGFAFILTIIILLFTFLIPNKVISNKLIAAAIILIVIIMLVLARPGYVTLNESHIMSHQSPQPEKCVEICGNESYIMSHSEEY